MIFLREKKVGGAVESSRLFEFNRLLGFVAQCGIAEVSQAYSDRHASDQQCGAFAERCGSRPSM
jgi:hypothetical protein